MVPSSNKKTDPCWSLTWLLVEALLVAFCANSLRAFWSCWSQYILRSDVPADRTCSPLRVLEEREEEGLVIATTKKNHFFCCMRNVLCLFELNCTVRTI